MTQVHPSAVVDAGAQLDHGVQVGPLCVIGSGVCVGAGTRLIGQVSLHGPMRIGANNTVYPFAALGGDPQHRDYCSEQREKTALEIGDDNVIREGVTVHRGTVEAGGMTRVGSGCLLMAGAHVAHDVVLDDGVVLTNAVLLGGHVRVATRAVIAGGAAIAPFVRVGESCFVAGNAMVERDVPPFLIAAGDRATLRAVNTVGLERRGVPTESVRAICRAFQHIFPLEGPGFGAGAAAGSSGVAGGEARKQQGRDDSWRDDPWVRRLLAFLNEPSRSGVMSRRLARTRRG